MKKRNEENKTMKVEKWDEVIRKKKLDFQEASYRVWRIFQLSKHLVVVSNWNFGIQSSSPKFKNKEKIAISIRTEKFFFLFSNFFILCFFRIFSLQNQCFFGIFKLCILYIFGMQWNNQIFIRKKKHIKKTMDPVLLSFHTKYGRENWTPKSSFCAWIFSQ